jgi:hypothetical protein
LQAATAVVGDKLHLRENIHCGFRHIEPLGTAIGATLIRVRISKHEPKVATPRWAHRCPDVMHELDLVRLVVGVGIILHNVVLNTRSTNEDQRTVAVAVSNVVFYECFHLVCPPTGVAVPPHGNDICKVVSQCFLVVCEVGVGY